MVNDDALSPDGEDANDGFSAAPGDLSDALSDLMATAAATGQSDAGDRDGGDDLDLSALEEAVAELGLDVGEASPPPPPPAPATPVAPAEASDWAQDLSFGADADDGPLTIDLDDMADLGAPEPKARPNPGLDLTELAPPSGAAAAGPPAERKLPPLGEATADDLFGPLDDEPDLGLPSTWSEPAEQDAPSQKDRPSPFGSSTKAADTEIPPLDPSGFEAPPAAPEPDLDAMPPPPPLAEADPAMADVVGFTAHGGTITGDIRAKAKKLFGRD